MSLTKEQELPQGIEKSSLCILISVVFPPPIVNKLCLLRAAGNRNQKNEKLLEDFSPVDNECLSSELWWVKETELLEDERHAHSPGQMKNTYANNPPIDIREVNAWLAGWRVFLPSRGFSMRRNASTSRNLSVSCVIGYILVLLVIENGEPVLSNQ